MVNGSVDRHVHEHVTCIKSISWTAVLAGALVGIGISFLLNLFSAAIGLTVFSTTADSPTSLAVGGFVGMLIGGIISTFLAGWTAGYLGRPYCARRNLGILYGFLAWALALIISIFIAAHIGPYVTAYTDFLGNPRAGGTYTTAAAVTEGAARAPQAVVNTDRATALSVSAFIVFISFFIGAVAACFGAHYGMVYKDREWDDRPGL